MEFIKKFKDFLLQQKNANVITVKNYSSDINHFISWYEIEFKKSFTPGETSLEIINLFKSDKLKSLSSASIERHLSSLRKFFKFLKLNGDIASSPFDALASSAQVQLDPYHLHDFKNFLYVYNASHLTIKNYIIDIKQFLSWAEEVLNVNDAWKIQDKDILKKIDNNLVAEYKQRLAEQKIFSPSSINRKLSSLRKYLGWAAEQGYIGELNEMPDTTYPQSTTYARPTNYSNIPPIRLFQKLTKFGAYTFDLLMVLPIANLFKKVEFEAWRLKGKPIFHANTRYNLLKNIKGKRIFGAFKPNFTNISKELFAPHTLSIKDFPLWKKIIFHIRYTRPNWYRKYHQLAIAHYFNWAVLIIFSSAIGFGLYNNFTQRPSKTLAQASLPNSPLRVLSFQGRLTDANDNPITIPKLLRFGIYSNQTASGSAKLWEEVDKVVPDPDGIFSISLGSDGLSDGGMAAICTSFPATTSCGIPSIVFSQYNAIWLGVAVENTPELTPREQVATVGYAENSEFLQGMPPITATNSGTQNVILALNSSGNLAIGSSTTFQATSGNFTLSGNTLILNTNSGTNGDISLTPDGIGYIDLNKPIRTTSSNSNISSIPNSVEVDSLFGILATSSGQSAFTIAQNGGGPIISASSSGTARLTLNNDGTLILPKYSTQFGIPYFADTAGTIAETLQGAAHTVLHGNGSAPPTWSAVDLTADVGSTILPVGNGGTGANLSSSANVGDILYADTTTTFHRLSIGSSSQCLIGGTTPSWSSCASGSQLWQLNNKVISPLDINNDLAVGGTSTSSSKFQIFAEAVNNGSRTPAAGTATTSGDLVFNSNPEIDYLNGNSFIFKKSPGGDGGLSSAILTLGNDGNVTVANNLTVNGTQITDSNYAGNNAIIYGAPSTGLFTSLPTSTQNLCLISGATTPSWTSCSSASNNLWQINNKVISPLDINNDLAIGGTSTSSAKFQVFAETVGVDVAGSATTSGNFSFYGTNTQHQTNILNGGQLAFNTSVGGDGTLNTSLFIANGNNPTAGFVGINTTSPTQPLTVNGNVLVSNGFVNANTASQGFQLQGQSALISSSINNLTLGSNSNWTTINYGNSSTTTQSFAGGQVGINTSSPLGLLDVRGAQGLTVVSGTNPSATISGQTSFAAVVVDNKGVGDLFTASTSGLTKFTILNSGSIKDTNYTTDKGVFFADSTGLFTQTAQGASHTILHGNGSAVPTFSSLDLTTEVGSTILPLANGGTNNNLVANAGGIVWSDNSKLQILAGTSTAGQCLVSGSSATPTWATCASGSQGVQYWQLNNKVLSPADVNNDLAVGGTATSSAKFQVFAETVGVDTAGQATTSAGFTFAESSGTNPPLNILNGNTLTFKTSPGGDAGLSNALLIGPNAIQFYSSSNQITNAGALTIASNLTVNGTTETIGNGAQSTIGTTNSALNLNSGSGVITLNNAGTGNIDFFNTSNFITSSGNLTLAGNLNLPLSGGIGGYWQLSSGAYGVLAPINTQNDLAVGGTATSSASFQVFGLQYSNSRTIPSGTATTSGLLVFRSNPEIDYLNGNSFVFKKSPGGDAGLSTVLTLGNDGNITIANNLTVSGNTTLGTNSTNTITANGDFNTSLIPTSSTLNLGSASNNWGTVFATSLNLPVTGGIDGFWQLNSGVLSPNNIQNDLVIGGTATTSARFHAYSNVNSGTTPAASASATSSFAALLIDNSGVGDLFTASTSGLTKFTILNSGSIRDTNYTTAGGVFYADGTGLFTQTAQGNVTQCLVGGTTPSWSACSAASNNLWQLNNKVIAPLDVINNDLAIGGAATSSAKFQVFAEGVNNGSRTPPSGTATTSGNLVFSSSPEIDFLNGNNLTFKSSVGGDAGLGSVLTLANNGNLTSTGVTTTFSGPNPVLTANGASTLTLNLNSTGSIQFFSSSNFINNTGGLTLAGTISLPNSNNMTGATNGTLSFVQLSNGVSVGGANTFYIDKNGNAVLNSLSLSTTGGLGGFWQLNSGVLAPTNIQNDLAIGGTATGSATPFQIFANTFNTEPAGTASTSGFLTYRGTAGSQTVFEDLLLNGSNLGFYPSVGGDAGVGTPALYIKNNSNVGIGTNAPTTMLDEVGSFRLGVTNGIAGTIYGSAFTRSSGLLTFPDIYGNNTNALVIAGKIGGSGIVAFGSGTSVGINTNTPLTNTGLDIEKDTNGNAELVVNQLSTNANGDLFTASSSGTTKFLLTNSGSIGAFSGVTDAGILSTFDVRANSGTTSVASVSGKTSFASLVVDNSGVGDVFTASTSGQDRFVVKQSGRIGINIDSPANTLQVAGDQQVGKDATNWGVAGYTYRRQITINNNSGNTLNNYQVKLVMDTASLITAGKMTSSSCNDLRFTDFDGTVNLNYWIEGGCNTNFTTIWIKVPTITAPTRTIYAYYGNSGASSASSAANTFVDVVSNVQAAYNLDEPTYDPIVDYSTNGNVATASGTTVAGGKFNLARQFNGTSDYIAASNSASLSPLAPFTVSAWFKTTMTSQGTILDHNTQAGGTQNRYILIIGRTAAGKVDALLNAGGTSNVITSTNTYNDGNWHYVLMSLNGTTFSLTIDNVAEKTITIGGAWAAPNGEFDLGDAVPFINPVTRQNFFNGQIDEARVYNASLSATQEQEFYSGGGNNYGYVTTQNPNTELIASYTTTPPTTYLNPEQTSLQTIPSFYVQNSTGNVALGTLSIASTSARLTVAGDIKSGLYDTTAWGANYATMSARARILVDNSKASAGLTNYLVKVTTNTSAPISLGKMRSDCGDLRFADADGNTALTYWIEPTTCNTANTIIWVKIPLIPSNDTKNIYMYYSNPTLITQTNTNIFIDNTITGVQGAWRFDETSPTANVVDYSGNSNTGTSNGTTVQGGYANNARYFNGTSDYVSVSDSSSLQQSSPMSIALWFNTVSTAGVSCLLRKDTQSGTRYLYGINLSDLSTGKIGAQYYNGVNFEATSSAALNDGKWHFAVMTISGSGHTAAVTLYIDAVSQGSTTISVGSLVVPTGELDMGACPPFNGGGRGNYYTGAIDEATVYNTALTSSQITNLYNSRTGYGYVTTNSAQNEYVRPFNNPEPVITVDTEQDPSQVDPTLFVSDVFNNVGVNTANPVASLDVVGTSLAKPAILAENNSNGDLISASASGTPEFELTSTGNMITRKFTSMNNNNYFLDPASLGTSLVVAGSVGIGTTSPGSLLTVSGSDSSADGKAAAIQLSNTAAGGGNWYLRAGATGTHTPAGGFTIANDSNYWLTITSGGNVSVGTLNNPDNNIFVASMGAALAPNEGAVIVGNSTGGGLMLEKPEMPTASGIRFGLLAFGAPTSPSNVPNYGPAIAGLSSQSWSSSVGGGELAFYTQPNGTSGNNRSERMRIDQAGNVGIGTTSPNLDLAFGGAESGNFGLQKGDASPQAGYLRFGDNSGWKFIIGRTQESVGGAINTTTTGALVTVQDNGNVGIANTSPGDLFDVNGTTGTVSVQSNPSEANQNRKLNVRDDSNANTGMSIWNAGTGGSAQAGITYLENSGGSLQVRFAGIEGSAQTNGGDFVFQNLNNTGKVARFSMSNANGSTLILLGNVIQNSTPDIAENIHVNDTSINAGDIISADANAGTPSAQRTQSEYDPTTLGVVSTHPGFVLNSFVDNETNVTLPPDQKPLVLAGRVPLKVMSKNGNITVGDHITSSILSGYGEKAVKAGSAVATALQTFTPSNTTCPAVASVSHISWPPDDGTNPSKPCFKLPDGTYVGKIMAFVKIGFYDPDTMLASLQGFSVSVQNGVATVTDSLGNSIYRIGVFSQGIFGTLQAGIFNAQQIATNSLAVATDNVSIAGLSLKDYILSVIKDSGFTNNVSNITSPIAEVNELHTNLISPLASNSAIAISLDNSGISINNKFSQQTVARIDNLGNATFSGQLNSQNLAVNGDATVSGTLYADKIKANNIDGLSAVVSTLSAQNITQVTNIFFATPSASPIAGNIATGSNSISSSSSGVPGSVASLQSQVASQGSTIASNPTTYDLRPTTSFANIASYSAYFAYVPNLNATTGIFQQGLTSLGPTSLMDTTIVGQLSINSQLIIADNSINVLGNDFNIQPLKQGGVNFEGGLIAIDTNGDLSVNGKGLFKDGVFANIISPIGNNNSLTIQLGQNPQSSGSAVATTNLSVQNASGSGIFTVDQLGDLVASGAATIGKLNLSFVQPALAVSDTEVVATGSAGTATINPYQHEVNIDNPNVTANSLIYITPVGTTQTPYLERQVSGQSFSVGVPAPLPIETKFNWLIVN